MAALRDWLKAEEESEARQARERLTKAMEEVARNAYITGYRQCVQEAHEITSNGLLRDYLIARLEERL